MIIQEKFDESLVCRKFTTCSLSFRANELLLNSFQLALQVMLRRKLCWRLEDVLYLTAARNKSGGKKPTVSWAEKAAFER